MKKDLTVSVVTVCLNSKNFIKGAIDSVIKQKYSNIEYLIIDGGSEDGTMDIIKNNEMHIDYYISEPDKGIYNAMNKGISNSTGDILFFLNSDDRFVDENVVDDIVKIFKDNPDVDLVYGDVILAYPDIQKRWIQHSSFSRKNLARGTISHQSIFVKRKIMDMTNGFSEKFKIVGDYVWLMELAHSNINSMHVKRDITTVSTEGLSHTTEWENERIIAMRKYYTPLEILLWRSMPRKAKSMANSFKRKISRKL